jgi:hypothetical protein
MASVMQRAITIDDTNSATQEERINALILENRGLKEILAVHENMQQQKQATTDISQVRSNGFTQIPPKEPPHAPERCLAIDEDVLLSVIRFILFSCVEIYQRMY